MKFYKASKHTPNLGKSGLFICLVCLWVGVAASADPIVVLTHNTKGSVYTDNTGEARGRKHAGRRAFTYELVREMLLNMGLKNTIRDVPLVRGLHLTQNQNNHALFHLSWRKDREALFQWVGPIITNEFYLYKHASNLATISSVRKLDKNTKFCLVKLSNQSYYIIDLGFDNIITANSYDACLRMLASKRVDYTSMALNDISGALAKLTPIARDSVVQTTMKLGETKGYIALSKQTPSEIIHQWQTTLDEIKSSGRYQKLAEDYLFSK